MSTSGGNGAITSSDHPDVATFAETIEAMKKSGKAIAERVRKIKDRSRDASAYKKRVTERLQRRVQNAEQANGDVESFDPTEDTIETFVPPIP